MMEYRIVRIREKKELMEKAAEWFHLKWGIARDAYEESMQTCIREETAVPQWYVVLKGETIIAGVGVIENDFHERKDLTPNVCALYVEEEYRNQGIAGQLLEFVYKEFRSFGISTLYLLTDHTSFYERYGWEFLCMVQGSEEAEMSRMYIHNEGN